MWCASCQTDVAGEVSPDAKSLLCTTCGGEVSSIKTPGNLPTTRGAQELLERWNTEEILDPYQPGRRQQVAPDRPSSQVAEGPREEIATAPSTPNSPASTDETKQEREPRVARRPTGRTFRVDNSHATAEDEGQTAHAPHEPRDVHAAHGSRVDASHAMAPSPHFNIDAAFDQRRKPGRGESLWGQLLAYAGVGVLTVGTGLVVWGYFGGPDSYTPTGWLLATAGQMLLFLGVVTLISGGMEQTTHEVTQRIERLGETIIRIERHTSEQALRGPHFAVSEDVTEKSLSARATDASS